MGSTIRYARPPSGSCSPTSEATTIASGSTRLSATSLQSRPSFGPHNPVSILPGEAHLVLYPRLNTQGGRGPARRAGLSGRWARARALSRRPCPATSGPRGGERATPSFPRTGSAWAWVPRRFGRPRPQACRNCRGGVAGTAPQKGVWPRRPGPARPRGKAFPHRLTVQTRVRSPRPLLLTWCLHGRPNRPGAAFAADQRKSLGPVGIQGFLTGSRIGRSDRIRTCDPQTPSLMRYQAALRSVSLEPARAGTIAVTARPCNARVKDFFHPFPLSPDSSA